MSAPKCLDPECEGDLQRVEWSQQYHQVQKYSITENGESFEFVGVADSYPEEALKPHWYCEECTSNYVFDGTRLVAYTVPDSSLVVAFSSKDELVLHNRLLESVIERSLTSDSSPEFLSLAEKFCPGLLVDDGEPA